MRVTNGGLINVIASPCLAASFLAACGNIGMERAEVIPVEPGLWRFTVGSLITEIPYDEDIRRKELRGKPQVRERCVTGNQSGVTPGRFLMPGARSCSFTDLRIGSGRLTAQLHCTLTHPAFRGLKLDTEFDGTFTPSRIDLSRRITTLNRSGGRTVLTGPTSAVRIGACKA